MQDCIQHYNYVAAWLWLHLLPICDVLTCMYVGVARPCPRNPAWWPQHISGPHQAALHVGDAHQGRGFHANQAW